jgi:hypothetical protein
VFLDSTKTIRNSDLRHPHSDLRHAQSKLPKSLGRGAQASCIASFSGVFNQSGIEKPPHTKPYLAAGFQALKVQKQHRYCDSKLFVHSRVYTLQID